MPARAGAHQIRALARRHSWSGKVPCLRARVGTPKLPRMTSPPAGRRLLLAFLAAPLAAPVAYVLATLAVQLLGSGSAPSMQSALDLVIGVFVLGAPTAYAAAFLVGVPTYFVLRRLGLVSRWTLWLAGAAIGAAGAATLTPWLRGGLFSIDFPWWTGALLGVVSAEVFWWVGTDRSRRSPG